MERAVSFMYSCRGFARAQVLRDSPPRPPRNGGRRATKRHLRAFCRKSDEPDGKGQDDISMENFWRVVTNRETENTHCCTNPDFLRKKEAHNLPDVNWARYNQQILFVDRSDTVRARSAAGLFEVVCHWNCMDMVLVQDRCGVDVEPGGYMDPGTAMSLVALSQDVGISSRLFTRQRQCFETDDFYRYDLIIALDSSVKEALVDLATQEAGSIYTSNYLKYFHSKIARLSDFAGWCSDEDLSREAGSAILPRRLARLMLPALPSARMVVDIERLDLRTPESRDQWTDMKFAILVGVAGLTKYLMDSIPEDLPHWSHLGDRR